MTDQPDTHNGSSITTDAERIAVLFQVMEEHTKTIEDLVGRVTGFEARIGDPRGVDRRDQPQQPDQPQQVGQLRPKESVGAESRPLDWYTLSLTQQAELFEQLAAFVQDLVHRHDLQDRIRPCWWRHNAAVEELTALWTARQVAFAASADASMPSWWQDLLERSGYRLRRVFVKCRKAHVGSETSWMSQDDRVALEQEIEQRRTAAVSLPPHAAGSDQEAARSR